MNPSFGHNSYSNYFMKRPRNVNMMWKKPPKSKGIIFHTFQRRAHRGVFFPLPLLNLCKVWGRLSFLNQFLSLRLGNIPMRHKKLENEQKLKLRTYGIARRGLGFPVASILPTTFTVGNTRQHSIWHFLLSPTDSGKQYVLQLKHALSCQTLMATSAVFRKSGFPNQWPA